MSKYIPFLKLKSNEIIAINELNTSVLNKITPFFDYPRSSKLPTNAQFEQTTKRLSKSLLKHIGLDKELYFDNFDLIDDLNINGVHNYYFFLQSLSDHNIIPVLGIDRTDKHSLAVEQALNDQHISSNVIAFRILPQDFDNYAVFQGEIEETLEDVIEKFENIDLIFDCRLCTTLNPEKTAKDIVQFAEKFINDYETRRIIVTGSSIPASIGEILHTNSSCAIDRNELNIFKKVQGEKEELNFIFGDYTTVSPYYSDFNIDPKILQNIIAAKISYSFDDKHYFIRGGSIKANGLQQYSTLADDLCNKPFYRGSSYSTGDNYFEAKKLKQGNNCTPSTIIKPSVVSHITYMVNGSVI